MALTKQTKLARKRMNLIRSAQQRMFRQLRFTFTKNARRSVGGVSPFFWRRKRARPQAAGPLLRLEVSSHSLEQLRSELWAAPR